MEPRGIVGAVRPGERPLHRAMSRPRACTRPATHAARALGVEPARLRFVAPDVGGGFGAKNFVYPEHVLIPWAAKRVGRPVKWIAGRGEVFLADHQGRGHRAEAELALDRDGRFLALRIASNANLGAYLSGSGGGVQTFQYAFLPGTVYRIPAIALRVAGVFTNTAPYGVLRGPGYAEMVNIVERLIDRAAEETGIDRAELRRRNLVPAAAMPAVQRLRQQHRQRRLSRHFRARPSPPPTSPASPRGGATARRGDGCAGSVSPITSRRPAARRRRMSISASSRTARWR